MLREREAWAKTTHHSFAFQKGREGSGAERGKTGPARAPGKKPRSRANTDKGGGGDSKDTGGLGGGGLGKEQKTS